MVNSLSKDDEYWNAIKKEKELTADIKFQETVLVNLQHLRMMQMERIVKSKDWIADVDPRWNLK